ncbi:hypothetical protein EYF80_063763 [Liparis tanakae]|uniref:Uncharacterized protein n=1 Tax=Liparis tanakae TaxID=230148 RepID=A0A4Z2ECS9_9TELE|nr:hypothetical protein EYF80_063763 [Liparis tanakae]
MAADLANSAVFTDSSWGGGAAMTGVTQHVKSPLRSEAVPEAATPLDNTSFDHRGLCHLQPEPHVVGEDPLKSWSWTRSWFWLTSPVADQGLHAGVKFPQLDVQVLKVLLLLLEPLKHKGTSGLLPPYGSLPPSSS